ETRQTLLNPYCTLYRVRMGHHKPHIEILFAFQLDNDIGHHHQSYYFESLQQLLFVEYATMAHGGCLMQLCVAHPSIFEQMYQEKQQQMRSADKDNDKDAGMKKRPKTSKGSTNGSKSHYDHPNAKTPRGERTNTSAAASLSKKPKTTRSTRSTKTAVVETTTTTKRPNLEMQVTKTVVSSETTSASSEGDSNHSEEEKMASPKTSGLEKLKQSNSAKQKKGLHQEFLEEVIDQLLEDIPSSEDEKTFAYNNCNTNNVVSKNAITATAKTAA
ncbi:hypothetical protein RFI_34886, partial [Reticulomyxa filosa]